ncbi:hypothetical protein LSAT2_028041 [Lamellibrachia satsuma]|nr:hypothetical protein LSAT2_028041 [Lamellibrachia satsuma]
MENASNISVLYCIQPENRLVDKYLRKKLGFLPTKHPKDIPHFEAALFRGLSDISRLIDPSQVTEEFGGTLTYNHTLWCQFVQMEQNIETRIQQLMDKIPKAKDRMHMFLEYDIPETTTEISALREQLRAMYHDTMRDLNIEHLIDECNKELEHLYSPTKYAQIMHTPLFNKAKVTIGEYREKLIGNRSHMKWLWQESDARLRQAVHVKKYEQKADKVMKWLLIVGLPTVHQEPEIADSLNKAHILKINFETGFYAVAQVGFGCYRYSSSLFPSVQG